MKFLTKFGLEEETMRSGRRREFDHLNAQYAQRANFADAQNPFTKTPQKGFCNRL